MNKRMVSTLFFTLFILFSCQKQEIATPTTPLPVIDLTGLNLPKGVKTEQVDWNKATGVITFLTSTHFSVMTNPDDDKEGFYWSVPTIVKTIVIGKNVQITGGVRVNGELTIEGQDRSTSEIFGTNTKAWSLGPDAKTDASTSCTNGAKGDDRVHDCEKWKYGAISGNTSANYLITIKNLTITNARSYAITSFGPKFLIDNIHIRNTRPTPDYHSNADGISGGVGTIIKNSKIDSWDDEIKLYRDMTVENVTLVHNSNGAPFQLGWGNDNNITNHSLKNILVVVKNQFYSNLALFSASLESGKVHRNVLIDGLKVQYESSQKIRGSDPMPLFLMKSADALLNLTATNVTMTAPVVLGGNGKVTGAICGSTTLKNTNQCGDFSQVNGCGW
ncbi:MAG: hypothetical protein R2822_28160 [Spirosomataceae bacterium]